MARYQWGAQSPVQTIDTISKNGKWEITLYGAKNLEPGSLHNLPHKLAQQGWFTVTDFTEDNQPIIKIYGIEKPESVINFLEENNFTAGAAQKTEIKEHIIKKKDSLVSSGWLYYFGDLLFMAGGKYRGNSDISTGSAIKSLSSGLLIYGRSVNPDNPLGRFVRNASKELQKHGIDISKYQQPDELLANKSFKTKINEFLSDYSVETLIGVNTIGDIFFAKSGKKDKGKAGRNYGVITQGGIGLVTAANLLATRILMENKHRMNPNSTLFKVTTTMENAALPVRAAGNMLGNAISIFETLRGAMNIWRNMQASGQNDKALQKDFWGNLMIAAANITFLAGNIQYARGKQKKTMPFSMNEATAAMANIIHNLPKNERINAVQETARFFATQDPEKRPQEFHAQRLYHKIELLDKSPFIKPESMIARINPQANITAITNLPINNIAIYAA